MPNNRQSNTESRCASITLNSGVISAVNTTSSLQPISIANFREQEIIPLLQCNVYVDIVCEDEKYMPVYANSTDACMDLKVRGTKIISPYSVQTFGTGIKVKVPDGYVMLIYPRSSTGMKLHCALANGTGVIDAGYRDEIKLALYNFGDYSVEIEDGQRIAQFVIIPRPYVTLRCVNDDKNFRKGDRGGGIGSTGR